MYLFDYSSEGGSHWINYATVELRNLGTTSAPDWSVASPVYFKDRIATYGYQALNSTHNITDGGMGILYTPSTDTPVQAIENVYFYLWRDAASSSNLEVKIYKASDGTLLAKSTAVSGSTVVLNDDYDPLTGSEGEWVRFKLTTTDATPVEQPVVLKTGVDYAIVVYNKDGEYHHVIGTATGSGYSNENDCQYISDASPFTLSNCSGSSESVNVRLEFEPVVVGSPLSSAPTTNSGNLHFGDDWVRKCPDDTGPWKLHTATDFTTDGNYGESYPVYATEDGYAMKVLSATGWAKAVVIQHTHPNGWNYTTVSWHIDPTEDLSSLEAADPEPISVAKGALIGHVAYLATGAHLHFGLRVGAYTAGVSGLGSLPVNACEQDSTTYPAFPNSFIDTNDSNYVQYQ
jgi:hypothetical protein